MLATPTFSELFYMQGFDDESDPPWQMVPVDGDRYVMLTDSTGLTIRSEYPPIAMWHEIKAHEIPGGGRQWLAPGVRAFRLHAGSKGSTSILVYERSHVAARLDVGTKFLKTLWVTFNFVRDKAGEKTVHKPHEVPQWVRELNQIFLPQCNMRIVCRSARWIRIDADLGWVIGVFPREVSSPKELEEQNLLVAKRDLGADVNVFHFNDFRPGNAIEDTAAGITSPIGGTCVFIDDDARPYATVLAHEIGHTQGLGHRLDWRCRDALMFRSESDGTRLNKDEVNKINP